MGYFDTKKGIEEYIKRSQGWGGQKLINVLKKYLPKKSTLLELGMGPGRDFDILKKTYIATGSDGSKAFLDRYKKKNKTAEIVRLDVVIFLQTGGLTAFILIRCCTICQQRISKNPYAGKKMS